MLLYPFLFIFPLSPLVGLVSSVFDVWLPMLASLESLNNAVRPFFHFFQLVMHKVPPAFLSAVFVCVRSCLPIPACIIAVAICGFLTSGSTNGVISWRALQIGRSVLVWRLYMSRSGFGV